MEILTKIGFDWQVALANLVNFLIIFYVLKRFVFKPISKILKEREEKIKEGVDNFERSKTALFEAKTEEENLIKEAKKNASLIIQKAEEESELVKQKRQKEAETEADKILKEARQNIDKEKIELEKSIKEKTIDMIISGTEKILKKNIDKQSNENLIKENLEQIKF